MRNRKEIVDHSCDKEICTCIEVYGEEHPNCPTYYSGR